MRECLEEGRLESYSTVILDEAHERTVSSDLLTSLLKQAILHDNKDLKLVIMSATLEVSPFLSFFPPELVQTVSVPGRTFPIQVSNQNYLIKYHLIKKSLK